MSNERSDNTENIVGEPLLKELTHLRGQLAAREQQCLELSQELARLKSGGQGETRERDNLQAKLVNAIEMAHLGPWEYDVVNDRFTFDDYFYKMFRTTSEQVGGYTMTSAEYARRFVHPDDISVVGDETRRAIATKDPGYSRQLEHRIRYADGTVGYINVRFFIQKDAHGQTVKTYGVNQDITERKRSEEALRELNEALSQRNELAEARAKQLQNLAVELIEAEEQERRRIAGLLHNDVQQLLASARFMLQSCSHSGSDLEEVQRLLEMSIRKTRHLSHELSPAVLDYSGLTAGLQWMCEQMKKQFGLQVTLKTNTARQYKRAPLKVFIFRAVQELLFNIVKHAGVQNAQVSMADTGDHLVITVSDAGKGFNPSILEAYPPKAGLGLLSLRERASYFGSSLTIESAPGKGCRMTLTVPIHVSSEILHQRDAITTRQEHSQAIVASGMGMTRVLFVDDHHVIRKGLIGLVAGRPDIEVVGEAANGWEALELTRQLRPDVVVMNISMSQMDGIEATRRLKTELPDVRVMGLSMHDDERFAASMRQAGAEAFVSKNTSPAELLKMIYGIAHP
jgi:signal transduction histidine kinase/CheY-like chemotaxis protein